MLKRIGLILLAALFGASTAASADAQAQGERWAKGMVQSAQSEHLYAPMGGQIAAFDWQIGDEVTADVPMFSIRPLELRAPERGAVRLIGAEVGDLAESTQYGALMYIERTDIHWVRSSISGAHDKPDNRAPILGEAVRVYNDKSSDPIDAVGTIVSVSGDDYVVEIPSGIFELEDNVKIYRGTIDSYKNPDRIGRGQVARPPMIAIAGQGIVADLHVQAGDWVEKGELLLSLDAAHSRHDAPARRTASAPLAGMISALFAQPGQWVEQGQRLATVDSLDQVELVVEVDEVDLDSVRIGQTMRVKVDALPDAALSATVAEISRLPIVVLDTTKYQVTLSIQAAEQILWPGMHATAYW